MSAPGGHISLVSAPGGLISLVNAPGECTWWSY